MTGTYQVVVVLTSRATAGSKYLVVLHKKSKIRYYSGNNRAKVLPFDSFDLYDKLIRKICVRSHGNFFICFADFPAPWKGLCFKINLDIFLAVGLNNFRNKIPSLQSWTYYLWDMYIKEYVLCRIYNKLVRDLGKQSSDYEKENFANYQNW